MTVKKQFSYQTNWSFVVRKRRRSPAGRNCMIWLSNLITIKFKNVMSKSKGLLLTTAANKVWLLMRGKPIPGRVDDVKRKTGWNELFIKRCSTLSERLQQSNKSLDRVTLVPIFLEKCSFEVIARFWTVGDLPGKKVWATHVNRKWNVLHSWGVVLPTFRG